MVAAIWRARLRPRKSARGSGHLALRLFDLCQGRLVAAYESAQLGCRFARKTRCRQARARGDGPTSSSKLDPVTSRDGRTTRTGTLRSSASGLNAELSHARSGSSGFLARCALLVAASPSIVVRQIVLAGPARGGSAAHPRSHRGRLSMHRLRRSCHWPSPALAAVGGGCSSADLPPTLAGAPQQPVETAADRPSRPGQPTRL